MKRDMPSFLIPMGFGAPGGLEIVLILIVVLILFGTKNLPHVARTLGRTLEEFRRAARDVSNEITRADLDDDLPRPTPKKLPSAGDVVSRQDPYDDTPDEEASDPSAEASASSVKKETDEKT